MTQIKETVRLRLKKKNLKINATLSALFNSLGLVPTKVLASLSEVAKQSPSENKFFVDLRVFDDQSFQVKLAPSPDSYFLKQISKGEVSRSQLLEYASTTMTKSFAFDVESRVKELEGCLKSFR